LNDSEKGWVSSLDQTKIVQGNGEAVVSLSLFSPLAILASFFLVFYMLHLKEEHTFQEPSLATRLDQVFPHKSSLKLDYIELRPGVKYIKIIGGMEN
jgi:hypothetical protein